MSKTKVINLFKILARSQGYYGRLLEALDELKELDRDAYDDYFKQFKNCKSDVEVVMMVEC